MTVTGGVRRAVPYALVVGVLTFVVLLISAGVRAAPGLLIKPLEADFGWDRGSISLAVAVASWPTVSALHSAVGSSIDSDRAG